MILRKSEQKVLDKAKALHPEPCTPTMLGLALGYTHTQASSRVAPALKELVEKGLMVRDQKGSAVVYRVSEAGLNVSATPGK